MLTRRRLLIGGAASLLAAPAIVRAASLMRINPRAADMALVGCRYALDEMREFDASCLVYYWIGPDNAILHCCTMEEATRFRPQLAQARAAWIETDRIVG